MLSRLKNDFLSFQDNGLTFSARYFHDADVPFLLIRRGDEETRVAKTEEEVVEWLKTVEPVVEKAEKAEKAEKPVEKKRKT